MVVVLLRITHAAERDKRSIDNAPAVPIACAGSRSLRRYRIKPRAPTTSVITARPARAVVETVLILPTMATAPTKAYKNSDKAAAVPMACAGLRPLSRYRIKPRAPTTSVTTPSVTSIFSGFVLLNLLRMSKLADIAVRKTPRAIAVPRAWFGSRFLNK